MDTELELCCGTISQAGLPELIDVAGAAGFAAITANPTLYHATELSDAELRKRMGDAGVRVSNIDGFGGGLPGIPSGEALVPYRSYFGRDVTRAFTTPEPEFYRAAEALGAESINLVHFGGDPHTPFDAIAEATAGICERAGRHGIRVVFEFIPATAVPDIATAASLVERIGVTNLGIMFDTRHLTRSGGNLEDVARHAALIDAVQLSDVLYSEPDDADRLLPGEGELPLAEMVSLIAQAKPGVPIGIEVFSNALRAMTARGAAQAAGDSLRRVLEISTQASG